MIRSTEVGVSTKPKKQSLKPETWKADISEDDEDAYITMLEKRLGIKKGKGKGKAGLDESGLLGEQN